VKINDSGKPVPTPKNGAICFDKDGTVVNPYIIDSNLSPIYYSFVWSSAGVVVGTQSTLTTITVGQYSLVATSKITGCVSDVVLVDVAQAVMPIVTTVVTAEFTGNTIITVNATPTGNYEYQLDGGNFQTSNVFTNVTAGSHKITVITGACQSVVVNAAVVDYPHYFTPNGDGINDHWNIIGLDDEPNAKIYIFDRFGKLLKQISSTSLGWDGTFNGQLLPSTDYWFTVEYTEAGINKMFKAHFSLKR
jgi:valyl-tRNA synthetase